MSLFELNADGLVPFRHFPDGKGVFENRIEDLLWSNLNDLTGEVLFPIARNVPTTGDAVADIVALDASGAVIVVDVTRGYGGANLAQTLEFAGWARSIELPDLAEQYAGGAEKFYTDWCAFTETDQAVKLSREARLIIAARHIHPGTQAALDYLQALGVPVAVIRLSMYEDTTGRLLLDIETLESPKGQESPRVHVGVAIADLMTAGLLGPGERLEWVRPRSQTTHSCYVAEDGRLLLEDCTVATSPSVAASRAAGVGAYDGWEVWHAPDRGGVSLDELRERYLALHVRDELPDPPKMVFSTPRSADAEALETPGSPIGNPSSAIGSPSSPGSAIGSPIAGTPVVVTPADVQAVRNEPGPPRSYVAANYTPPAAPAGDRPSELGEDPTGDLPAATPMEDAPTVINVSGIHS